MKRAVSSLDSWGAREGAAATAAASGDRRVVKLKRCKSAFANLKLLGTASPPPPVCAAAEEAATGAVRSAQEAQGSHWNQLLGQQPLRGFESTPASTVEGPSPAGGSVPFLFGAAVGYNQQQQQQPSTTDGRYVFSSSSSGGSSPRRGDGAVASTGLGVGDIGFSFSAQGCRRHSSFSNVKTCGTVPEQPHVIAAAPSSSAAPLASRCPFLQHRQQQQQQRRRNELLPQQLADACSGGGGRLSLAGESAVGFGGWGADPAGGSPPGFSIVGFADVDDHGGATSEEEEEEEEEDLLWSDESSRTSSWTTTMSSSPARSPRSARSHRQRSREQEDEKEDAPPSPMMLPRLQRRFEDMLLVSNNATALT